MRGRPGDAGRRRRAVALLLLAGVTACAAEDIKLGFLYIQSSSSWVVESFSQFKLGVQDVNAAGLLGGLNLSFTAYDTRGDSLEALAGAIALLADEQVVGLVGTGYSSAAAAAAMYSSLRFKPMVSPGSTAISLVDKAIYPYFMRAIANDEQQMKSMAAIVIDSGWWPCV